MPGFLTFSSLGISAGLYLYGVENNIIPLEYRFLIMLVLMAAGVVIAYTGARSGKARSEGDLVKLVSEASKLVSVGSKQ